MPSNHLILCYPLLLPPSVFSSIRVFSSESVLCIRWPKYWSFSFSDSPSNEYSGLISFKMDWLDLLAVQGTLKSLLQHHGSKASILCSAFFIVQLSYPYMTTRKTIALIIIIIIIPLAFLQKVPTYLFPTVNKVLGVLPCPWFTGSHSGPSWVSRQIITKVTQSCPTLCDPKDYSPWDSPGKSTGVGSLSLLQGIFPTQGSNLGLPQCGQILYQLSHRGSPDKGEL